MGVPIIPIDEDAAEPTAVDYPVKSVVEELDAERTKAPDITDTGYIWDQSYPGDDDPMITPDPPKMRAVRTTEVSDQIIFGGSNITGDTPPFILVPAHRDRVRVTIQADYDAATPPIYLGQGPDLSPGNGWALLSDMPVVFHTRDAIYAVSGTAAGATRIQWAIELVSEGCGCQ